MTRDQTKDDLKPRITTKDNEEVTPAPIRGDETDKPITGAPRPAERQGDTQRPDGITRDDGDNDGQGELK